MIVVSVIYGPGERFDEAYYLERHMPLVRSRWAGLVSEARVLKGLRSADGGAPAYPIITEIAFASMAELQQAMGGPHAAEITADVKNFTDVQPTLQISEVIG